MQKFEVVERFKNEVKGQFHTVLVDPPWRFLNRTGKISPEKNKLHPYPTLSLDEIKSIPVQEHICEPGHLYLWVPSSLMHQGFQVMEAWGFEYKSLIVWRKIRRDGGTDAGGVGFYFRNAVEIVLFGVRGKHARTLSPGRTQVNLISSRKQGHSRKPDELYRIIESCSGGPYLEMFARKKRLNWEQWGNQLLS